jgi:hypothetical protein
MFCSCNDDFIVEFRQILKLKHCFKNRIIKRHGDEILTVTNLFEEFSEIEGYAFFIKISCGVAFYVESLQSREDTCCKSVAGESCRARWVNLLLCYLWPSSFNDRLTTPSMLACVLWRISGNM